MKQTIYWAGIIGGGILGAGYIYGLVWLIFAGAVV